MYQDEFVARLIKLRTEKGVSARDMSLSIGQNAGYINTIESGKSLPSMAAFFYICEYLGITPCDFFDTEMKSPEKYKELLSKLKQLDDQDFDIILELINRLLKK